MQLDLMLKLIANQIGIPPELIEEMKGLKVAVDSSRYIEGMSIFAERSVTLILSSRTMEPFPLTVTFPEILMDRLPLSIRTTILEKEVRHRG